MIVSVLLERTQHDLCAIAALLQVQKSLQRQRGRDALSAHADEAHRASPEGGEGAEKEEAILAVDIWPDPWALDKTDPALRRHEEFPLSDEGRAAAARCLEEAYNAEPGRWKNLPSILDCEPWAPPAEPEEGKAE